MAIDYVRRRLGDLARGWAVAGKRVLLPIRLSLALPSNEPLSVVQIGSNDGRSGDPIHGLVLRNRLWTALLVEPVPYLFGQLVENYPDRSRFRFENAAIAGRVGSQPFFHVDPSVRAEDASLPDWVEQLGSFDRAYIERHFGGRLSAHIREIEVSTLTLEALLEKHEVSHVDFLHIDTEGHDLVVIHQLDFSRYHPRVILFEHKHLSASDRTAAVRLVRDQGFRVERWGGDYLCVARR